MIRAIDKASVHRITSGQVVVDLQTAVKELVENSLDAGATNIEVKFRDFGISHFEVTDNGSGISPNDYEIVGLKHYTSKLKSFEDLTSISTFGFRGEAISSLCALAECVTITTATTEDTPMGSVLELDRTGHLKEQIKKVARQRGTTVRVEGLFRPLPVRRKELERNAKREYGKALNLLSAYALVPCAGENKGVRLSVVHQQESGKKSIQLKTNGQPSIRSSISSLWGTKQLDSLADLSLDLEITPEKSVVKRAGGPVGSIKVHIRGFISKFASGYGRASTDRQFFYINGRPCSPVKIQKAVNEVYRTYNTNQSPFVIADFILPRDTCDINVSPDKRTILLHSENALVEALKGSLEKYFSSSRSTYSVNQTQSQAQNRARSPLNAHSSSPGDSSRVQNQSEDRDFEGQLTQVLEVQPLSEPFSGNPSDSGEQENTIGQSSSTCTSAILTEEAERLENNVNGTGVLPVDTAGDNTSMNSSVEDVARTKASDGKENVHTDISVPSDNESTTSNDPLSKPLLVASATSGKKQKEVQMILDTSGSAWDLRRCGSTSSTSEPPRKKSKLNQSTASSSATPRERLRMHIATFAQGSQNSSASVDLSLSLSEEDELDNDSDEGDNDGVQMAWEPFGTGRKPEAVKPSTSVEIDDDVLEESPERPLFASISPCGEEDTSGFYDSRKSPGEISSGSESGQVSTGKGEGSSIVKTEPEEPVEFNASGNARPIETIRTLHGTQEDLVRFNFSRLRSKWIPSSVVRRTGSGEEEQSVSKEKREKLAPTANISNTDDEEAAERELSRVIHKKDFERMEILGQFNRGFIIARRRFLTDERDLDDLFIVDQHAADEKYNFETLQETTKIASQRLFRPRPLELTAADELVAMENIEILRNNGFEISINEDADRSSGRVSLIAQPVSKSTTFDFKDLEELLHLLQDKPSGSRMVRCSKARAMFASRACRKSVMIGDALTNTQMTTVVRHMGTMQEPWNCPHGRPTMRHLVDLKDQKCGSSPKRDISWNNL